MTTKTLPSKVTFLHHPLIKRVIESTLTINHKEYTRDLGDKNSESFLKLKKEIEHGLHSAFCNDMPPYAECKITVQKFENLMHLPDENQRSIFNFFDSLMEKIFGVIVSYEIQVKILECNLPMLHESLTIENIALENYGDLEIGEYSK